MAIRPSTISRFRASTRFMSVAVEPVTMPKRSAWRTRSATFALQISFLLGRQLVFGQEPPINLRSTTAVRCPDLAMCQAQIFGGTRCSRQNSRAYARWLLGSNSLFNANAPAFAGPMTLKIQFNGSGGLLTYMSLAPNAYVSALGSCGEAQCRNFVWSGLRPCHSR